MSVTEIRDQLLSLGQADRAELIGWVIDSLEGADPNDSNQDSLTEAIVRGKELESGAVEAVPKEEFLDEIRRSRGG